MFKKDYTSWSKEELIKELEKEKERKKYGLVWNKEKVPEKVVLECKDMLPIIQEVKDKEIITNKKFLTNILIEGDNYHALSVLNYTHSGKIDMIYIDPPYNTGNGDTFVYNDKIIDREDSYRHSKWLSFMEKRLKLAKNLLTGTGIIFISIDDNEQAHLKVLCDEIFNEKNFISQFVWNKKTGRQNDAKFVSTNHEYILCYSKNIEKCKFNLIPRTDETNQEFANPDNDPRGLWIHRPLHAKSGTESSKYKIKFPNGVEWEPPIGTYPRFSKEKLLEMYNDKRIWFGKTGKNVPRYKRFFTEVKQGIITNTLLMADEVGNTQKAKQDYQKFMTEVNFDNPKPIALMEYLVLLGSNANSTILDFFAGSGTTAHAVLNLNKKYADNNRKFIICTNNENNICTGICYPRIKNVIKGYNHIEGTGGNLKYFKTDFVEAKITDANKKKLVNKSTEMLCLKEGCFDKVLEMEDFRIYKDNKEKLLGIIYNDDGIEPFKKELNKIKRKAMVYVFSLDESAREEEFEDVANLVELKPIPAVILNVYKRIFK